MGGDGISFCAPVGADREIDNPAAQQAGEIEGSAVRQADGAEKLRQSAAAVDRRNKE